MLNKDKILLVEDDQVLGYVVKEFLQVHNFDVFLCTDSDEAWHQFMRNKFKLCLVDIVLPGVKDGVLLAKNIRKKNMDIPIILLSSKSMTEDVLVGFENGADDYIIKPFNLKELLLRIQVFIKRSVQEERPMPAVQRIGDLNFDYVKHTLGNDEMEHQLTDREAELIYYLSQNANRVIKREEILMAIWGKDDFFLGRSMDVFITKIRKYLKSQTKVKLETIHGIGFKFKNDVHVELNVQMKPSGQTKVLSLSKAS